MMKSSYNSVAKTGMPSDMHQGRFVEAAKCTTLKINKLYLDNTATYHSMFRKWVLTNVQRFKIILRGNCNTNVTSTSMKGSLGILDIWINMNVITSIISTSQLEAGGFRVTYDIYTEWTVYTPQSKNIAFKRETSMCSGISYIGVCVTHKSLHSRTSRYTK